MIVHVTNLLLFHFEIVDETPQMVIEKFVDRNPDAVPPNVPFSQFFFKVPGQVDYLVEDHRMIDYTYIRKSLIKVLECYW